MNQYTENKEYQKKAAEIRQSVLRAVHSAKASHVASALSIVDILTVLYHCKKFSFLHEINIAKRDSLLLSKGHACTALYATLRSTGDISDELFSTYGTNGSPLMHHISHKVPKVDFSTGSLGHGLPVSTGLAVADKINGFYNHRFCLVGDGELAEGSNWEAMLFAAHHELNNLTLIIDYNNLQSLDTVDNTLGLHPLDKKLEAFGWSVATIDGHNHSELYQAFTFRPQLRPHAIIARTTKGKGVSFMENSVKWHYKNPSDEELERALAEIKSMKDQNA